MRSHGGSPSTPADGATAGQRLRSWDSGRGEPACKVAETRRAAGLSVAVGRLARARCSRRRRPQALAAHARCWSTPCPFGATGAPSGKPARDAIASRTAPRQHFRGWRRCERRQGHGTEALQVRDTAVGGPWVARASTADRAWSAAGPARPGAGLGRTSLDLSCRHPHAARRGYQQASSRPLTTLHGHCLSGLSPWAVQLPLRMSKAQPCLGQVSVLPSSASCGMLVVWCGQRLS